MLVTDSAATVLRRFGPMIYGPTLLFALGEGAVIPLLPVLAAQLGADIATAALVASALVVGQLCGNLPAGWAVARIGERLTMAVAGVVSPGRRRRDDLRRRTSACSRHPCSSSASARPPSGSPGTRS